MLLREAEDTLTSPSKGQGSNQDIVQQLMREGNLRSELRRKSPDGRVKGRNVCIYSVCVCVCVRLCVSVSVSVCKEFCG
jgi:hypothetical protein